jgi:uncharacterized protein (TIGR02996 family)
METHDAFLQAIADEPDDDAVRLIYADWLDEHGDAPRAEFIRAQCGAETLPPGDERDALEDRAADLLAQHEGAWLGPLAAHLTEPEFRRGFVERAGILSHHFLADADALFRIAPACCYRFGFAGFLDPLPKLLTELLTSPRLDWVTGLDLRGEQVYVFHRVAHARTCGRVRYLDLSGTFSESNHSTIDLADLRFLAANPRFSRLRTLRLAFRKLGAAAAVVLASAPKWTALTRLDLTCNPLGDDGVRALAASTALERLERLELSLTDFGHSGFQALLDSPHLPQLHQLDLSPGLGIDHEALGRSRLLRRLTHLALERTGLDGEGLRRLALLSGPGRLTTLNLGENQFNVAALAALAAYPLGHSLRVLNLRHCGIDRDQLRALLAPQAFPYLDDLDLGDNPLGDEGVRLLARWPRLAQLRRLELRGTQMTAAGLRHLLAAVEDGRLRYLGLAHNLIGDDGLSALAGARGLRRLTELSAGNNKYTIRGLAALLGGSNWTRLAILRLWCEQLSTASVQLLRDAPLVARLRVLDLAHWEGVTLEEMQSLQDRLGHRGVGLDPIGCP